MKKPLSTTLIILFALLVWPTAIRGEAPAAAVASPGYHPAVTSFFGSKDPFVHQVVLPNIEANRKSNAVLKVVDGKGNPLAGAAVSARLKRHEFLFGHCDLATEKDPKRRALLNEIFHFTCPGNVTKWRAFAKKPDRNDFSKVDAVLDFCREHDAAFEWHFLSGYHPAWLEGVTPDTEKARYQIENARNVLRRYGDRVQFFQVVNEDWLTHIDRAKVFTDQTAWFSELRKEFPGVQLGVCDCWSFNPEGRLPGLDALKTRYPGIDFISMHAHKPRQLWASPRDMYETYDPYLDSGIKIHLTEFGIILGEITGGYRAGTWNEDNLAEYFVQAMTTAFSHRAVRVFNLWSNYEKFTGNPLFTEAGEPNEKYRAIKSLLQEKLTTRSSGSTDETGRFSFRGFHGAYDVAVTFPSGRKAQVQAEIGGAATELTLAADEEAAILKVLPPTDAQ
jgi:GH35 family endo-1,4-beta-xylanase